MNFKVRIVLLILLSFVLVALGNGRFNSSASTGEIKNKLINLRSSARPSCSPNPRFIIKQPPALKALPSQLKKAKRPRLLYGAKDYGRDALSFSADGELLMAASPASLTNYLVAGKTDGIRIWNVSTGRKILDLRANRIDTALLSRNGKMLFVSGRIEEYGGYGRFGTSLINLRTNKIDFFKIITDSFATSPDGQWLAASKGKTITLINLHTMKVQRNFSIVPHSNGDSSIVFTPDNHSILYQTQNEIALYNLKNRKVMWSYKASVPGTYFISAPIVSRTGKFIANISNMDKIRGRYVSISTNINIREAKSGNITKVIKMNSDNGATAVAFSPDERSIAASLKVNNYSPIAAVWDIRTEKIKYTFSQMKYSIMESVFLTNRAITFSPSGKEVALRDVSAGTIALWPVK